MKGADPDFDLLEQGKAFQGKPKKPNPKIAALLRL
jgi:hypothetical protein